MCPRYFITFAGLRWKKTIETTPDGVGIYNIDGNTFFDFDAAQRHGASLDGLRLPSKEEFDRLLRSPRKWDIERKGVWFADRETDLGDPDKSLFMEANGSRLPGGGWNFPGKRAIYWSSSFDTATSYGWEIYVSPDYAFVSTNYCNHGQSVRCVSVD